MKAHSLLLARKYSERPEHIHDGKVIVITTELWPKPSATAHADFADPVLDSIRIARP